VLSAQLLRVLALSLQAYSALLYLFEVEVAESFPALLPSQLR
jgi:hypothetical protein